MKGKTKKTHLRIKTPRKLHHAQDPGFQIKTLHLVVDIRIYIYMQVCQGPHQIKTLNLVVDIHIYVCMYVKAHTRGFSFCFSSFLRLLVLPSIQSNQSINTELDVTIR